MKIKHSTYWLSISLLAALAAIIWAWPSVAQDAKPDAAKPETVALTANEQAELKQIGEAFDKSQLELAVLQERQARLRAQYDAALSRARLRAGCAACTLAPDGSALVKPGPKPDAKAPPK